MYNAQITKDRIKAICKSKKINMEDMLISCNLGVNAIRQINDTKGLASFSLAKIADYLDCSVDYLLGRTDNPNLTGGTYINGNNNNNGNQAINGNINISTTEQDDIQLLEMIKKLDIVQRSKIITKIDEMENGIRQ